MAASITRYMRTFYRLSPSMLYPLRHCPFTFHRRPEKNLLGLLSSHPVCTAASPPIKDAPPIVEAASLYKNAPWDYLESEEYFDRYGTRPVWEGYRRNHKGAIPPQKTRKTCIRGDKTCGNPCPICRDPYIIIHHQNVKLLQQFISPHTGMVYDPTRTGVCMKQQQKLNDSIKTAQDHGLLPFQIPFVEFWNEDYSNFHDAVGTTPPAKSLTNGDMWYKWYCEITPDKNEVTKIKKTYRNYLK